MFFGSRGLVGTEEAQSCFVGGTSSVLGATPPLPTETHATVYHPAALIALRTMFAPLPEIAK